MKLIITTLLTLLSINIMAQKERFFTSKEAIEWLPQLIAKNIEIIGEHNDKDIKRSDKLQIEFLFITDDKEKAKSLALILKEEYNYWVYKTYQTEGFWSITGVTPEMIMEFDTFSKWMVDFCKTGFDEDAKLLHWNIINPEKAKQVDKFWNWFEKNQIEYYDLDPQNMDQLHELFDKLTNMLRPIHESLTFEFSLVMENGKKEFILSADGIREAFPDLLYLYKRSPDLEKWEIIPFRPSSNEDPQIHFENGFKLPWDQVMFTSKEYNEGLSIDFFIKNYDENDQNFSTGIVILLDSYLGEYDAVMQIRYVNIYRLDKKKPKGLKNFKELKQVVEEYKQKKRQE